MIPKPSLNRPSSSRFPVAVALDRLKSDHRPLANVPSNRIRFRTFAQKSLLPLRTTDDPEPLVAFNDFLHQNTNSTTRRWSQLFLEHRGLIIEVERQCDVSRCLVLISEVAQKAKETTNALDIRIETEDFGTLIRERDGSSFRPVRFILTPAFESLLHPEDISMRRCLSGGRRSDVQKLCSGIVSEMKRGNAVVLKCLGNSALYRTFQGLRLAKRELSKRKGLLSFVVRIERKPYENSGKKVNEFEFHLHEKEFEVPIRLPM